MTWKIVGNVKKEKVYAIKGGPELVEKGRKKIRTLLFLTIYFAFYNCDKQLQLILMFNELKIYIV